MSDSSVGRSVASDRTVHGHTFDGGEIVRYDRSGKWWVEFADSRRLAPRRAVTVRQAVEEALWDGDRAITDLPGGRRFDALVARRREELARA